MASLNKVLLMGNLTREPELRYTSGNSVAVCEFGIAINRHFTQTDGQTKEDTCFVDIIVWGKQGESCQKYLKKGSNVFIEGRLVYETWAERDTQKRRSRLRVTAERVQFLTARADGISAGEPMGMEEDPMQGGYAAPRQPMQYGGMQQQPMMQRQPMQQRQPYARQQYDAPPPQQQVYRSNNNMMQQQPMPPPQSMPEPEMPEEDPLENVDDIPF
ncbi:MAG: single-stranded DNA-binding protein [Lentisphaeria bacterium]|nr:single-stranded DNA-binding protein [Lentisphaeria bacterium]